MASNRPLTSRPVTSQADFDVRLETLEGDLNAARAKVKTVVRKVMREQRAAALSAVPKSEARP